MFSLNALDPKLVWHIEKETKEGLGAWRAGGLNGLKEIEGEKRNTETARKKVGKRWRRQRKEGKGNQEKNQ